MKNSQGYKEYQHSGEEWLGSLPKGWKVIKTKNLFNLITQPAPIGNKEELLSVYTALGVRPRKELEERGNKASTTDNYWLVKKGDIIVNKLLAWMGAIGISNYDGVTSPAYDILRAKEGVNAFYYNYLFRSPFASREFKRHSRGIMDMRLRLYFNRFGDIKLPYPSPEEQEQIVHFLDYKLSKVNRFIFKKKQLIKMLNEQKAGIISHAVTRGLDLNVQVKDSGVEWLGQIPIHWDIKKLKYSVRLNQHKDFENQESKDLKIALENIEGKTGRILKLNSNPFEGIGTIFKPGDVLFGKLRPYLAKVVAPNFEGSCVNEILVLTPNPLEWDSQFLKYRMLATEFIAIVNNSTYGAKMPRASWDFIGGLKVSCPSIEEQLNIVKSIELEHQTINELISNVEREIAIVEEYRTTLIAETVTGKIDVRKYLIPKTVEVDEIYDELEEELSLAAEEQENYETE